MRISEERPQAPRNQSGRSPMRSPRGGLAPEAKPPKQPRKYAHGSELVGEVLPHAAHQRTACEAFGQGILRLVAPSLDRPPAQEDGRFHSIDRVDSHYRITT